MHRAFRLINVYSMTERGHQLPISWIMLEDEERYTKDVYVYE
jgi:hypothetical protein